MVNRIKNVLWLIPVALLLAGCPERDPETQEQINDRGGPCYYLGNLMLEGNRITNFAEKRFLTSYDLPENYQIMAYEYNGNTKVKVAVLDQHSCVLSATALSREEYLRRVGLKDDLLSQER